MIRTDTYLAPTLEIYYRWFPQVIIETAKANLRRLNDAGAPVALGTDFEPELETGMPFIPKLESPGFADIFLNFQPFLTCFHPYAIN